MKNYERMNEQTIIKQVRNKKGISEGAMVNYGQKKKEKDTYIFETQI